MGITEERLLLKRQVFEYCIERLNNDENCFECPAYGKKICISPYTFSKMPINELKKEVDSLINGKPCEYSSCPDTEHITKKRGGHNKKRIKITEIKTGKVLGIFNSIVDANKATNISVSTISSNINKRSHSNTHIFEIITSEHVCSNCEGVDYCHAGFWEQCDELKKELETIK